MKDTGSHITHADLKTFKLFKMPTELSYKKRLWKS